MTDREAFEAWWASQPTEGLSTACRWSAANAWQAAIASERAKQRPTALEQFNKFGPRSDEETDPVERLRAFCSYAMQGQDWLDVEQFFDDVLEERAKQAEPVETGCVGPVDRKRPCGKCGALPGEPCPLYAAPPADDELMRTRSLNAELNNARAAVADQRDEAVMLLHHVRMVLPNEKWAEDTKRAIDAYLARVGK